MNWDSPIKDFSSYLRLERNVSKNTLTSYVSDINKFRKFCENNSIESPLKVDKQHINNYLSYIVSQKISARTQARYISSIKSFYEYLQLEERIVSNPTDLLESPKIGLKLPDTLSEEEINVFLQLIDLSEENGHRNKAIIEILYGCGLRVSEAIELRFSDLFFEEAYIRVTGKGNKQRLVPIARATIHEIELYTKHYRLKQVVKKGFEDYLFLNRRGAKLSRIMVYTIIQNIKAKAGFKKKISPHTFRHSFATHLLHNGADIRSIQLMLGHESITTTEIYTHIEQKHLNETILKYHPRNAK